MGFFGMNGDREDLPEDQTNLLCLEDLLLYSVEESIFVIKQP